MVVRTQLQALISARRAGDCCRHRAHALAARSPFLRLMAARIDRQRRPAACCSKVRDPRIVGDHEVSTAQHAGKFGPIDLAAQIDEATIAMMLVTDMAERGQLVGRAD